MTMTQLVELFEHIQKHHVIGCDDLHGKHVKYVDPHIDMRTNSVFSIQFRGYGVAHTLHTVNEQAELPESLFDRCMAFLDDEAWPKQDCASHTAALEKELQAEKARLDWALKYGAYLDSEYLESALVDGKGKEFFVRTKAADVRADIDKLRGE